MKIQTEIKNNVCKEKLIMITNEEYLMKHIRKAERDLINATRVELDEDIFSEEIEFIVSDYQIDFGNSVIAVESSYFNDKTKRKYNKLLINKLQYEMVRRYVIKLFPHSEIGLHSNTSPIFISIAKWFNSRNKKSVSIDISYNSEYLFKENNKELYEFVTNKSTGFFELIDKLEVMIDDFEVMVYRIQRELESIRYYNTVRQCKIEYIDNELNTKCITTYSRAIDNNHIIKKIDSISLGMELNWYPEEDKLKTEEIIRLICGLSHGNYKKIA